MPNTKIGMVLRVLSSRVYQHPNARLRTSFGHVARTTHGAFRTGYLNVLLGLNADALNTWSKTDIARIILSTGRLQLLGTLLDLFHRLLAGLGMYK